MSKVISQILDYVHPLLSEARSRIRYQRLVRSKQGAILRKMNNSKSVFIHIPKTGGKSILEGLYDNRLHEGFGHATASFYQSVFGCRLYSQFLKFAFVRNPWDRLFSGFKFAQRGGFGFHQDEKLLTELGDMGFESFVKIWLPNQNLDSWTIFRPQYKFICDAEEELMIDKVCYFEKIQFEYRHLSKRFDADINIPQVNKSLNSSSYLESYDDEMRKIVGELYFKDIELFGYVFEGLLEDRWPNLSP